VVPLKDVEGFPVSSCRVLAETERRGHPDSVTSVPSAKVFRSPVSRWLAESVPRARAIRGLTLRPVSAPPGSQPTSAMPVTWRPRRVVWRDGGPPAIGRTIVDGVATSKDYTGRTTPA
jgi:hypothetical protein